MTISKLRYETGVITKTCETSGKRTGPFVRLWLECPCGRAGWKNGVEYHLTLEAAEQIATHLNEAAQDALAIFADDDLLSDFLKRGAS